MRGRIGTGVYGFHSRRIRARVGAAWVHSCLSDLAWAGRRLDQQRGIRETSVRDKLGGEIDDYDETVPHPRGRHSSRVDSAGVV